VFYSPMKHRPAPERFCVDNIDFNTMNYMLFVNASRLEKNAAAFVRAFDNLSLKEQQLPNDLYVVLTGIEQLSDIGIKSDAIENYNKFILLPFLKPEHLEYLYQNASYLIYTSLYEGFGYPPLEAMYYGKPCLVSKVSAIPEVCGDAAVYCDPYDANSIARAIKNLILNKTQPEIINQRSSFINIKQRFDLQSLINFLIESL
jgi:glycosyltransferase involved in cell wall biosynthesis